MELLRRLAGVRADDEPEAELALAARCAHLPLALRVAAVQVAARPQASLAELVGELEEDAGGLDEYEVPGDPQADLRSVFPGRCNDCRRRWDARSACWVWFPDSTWISMVWPR